MFAGADKYKPRSIKNLVGQQGDKSPVQKLIVWLSDWYKNHARSDEKVKAKPSFGFNRNENPAMFKAALLSGPPGIGKKRLCSWSSSTDVRSLLQVKPPLLNWSVNISISSTSKRTLRINVRKSPCPHSPAIRTASLICPILHHRWLSTFWLWMKSTVWPGTKIEVEYKNWSRWSNDHEFQSSASATIDNTRRFALWLTTVTICDSIVRTFNRFERLCWLSFTGRTSRMSSKKHWIILFNPAIKTFDRRYIPWTSGPFKVVGRKAKQPTWSRRMWTTIRLNCADCHSRTSCVRNRSPIRVISSSMIINWCLYWSKRIIFSVNLICRRPQMRRGNWQIWNIWISFPPLLRVSPWEIYAHRWFLVKTTAGHYCLTRWDSYL